MRAKLRNRELISVKASENPTFNINFSIYENDDTWPAAANLPFNNSSRWEQVRETSDQIFEIGESASFVAGEYANYVAASLSFARNLLRLFDGGNQDDLLWSFNQQIRGSDKLEDNLRVPGHQSNHWIKIRTEVDN